MRKSSAAWKSLSVSSGMRRSSSDFGALSLSTGRSASARAQSSSCFFVPVKDLFSRPQDDPWTLQDIFVKLLEIADAVRCAGNVWVHADRHDARALFAVHVEAVEL